MSRTEVSVSLPSITLREQWSSHTDFLVSWLGYTVGLYNVWQFPYLTHVNGGGAFFIPYMVMLFFVGIPLTVLELTLGQFSSNGPTACWDFCRLFQGCGAAMVITTFISAVCYSVIISYVISYLLASFSETLPWATCGDWSTQFCSDNIHHMTLTQCIAQHAYIAHNNGTCIMPSDPGEIWIYNRTAAKQAGIKLTFAAQEYFERKITCSVDGSISNLGPINDELAFSLFWAWTIVFACMAKGIKITGKISYVTALGPYLVQLMLLIPGLALDGAIEGIKSYISPDMMVLTSARVWKEATLHVFMSLACSYGPLIALSSYNRFYNDVVRDSILVCLADAFTSILAGFNTFSYLGFLAKHEQLSVHQVTAQGNDLVFGIYPYSLTKLPGGTSLNVFFFLWLLLIGIDSQFGFMEMLIVTLVDSWPQLRYYRLETVLALCIVMFVAGLPMTTHGGADLVKFLNLYSGSWNVLVISVCECIAVGWLYGANRFVQDIHLMMDNSKTCWGLCKFYGFCTTWWAICWKYIAPCLLMCVIILSWVDYQPIEKLPSWADFIGWIITLSGICCIIGWGVYNVNRMDGVGLMKIIIAARPNKYWGPVNPIHRRRVAKYVEGFVINPHAEESEISQASGPYDTAGGSDESVESVNESEVGDVVEESLET